MVNNIYDGNLTVKESKTHGDISLGTYSGADVELVILNAVLYQAPTTGEVSIAGDSKYIPYLSTTFFHQGISFELNDKINCG